MNWRTAAARALLAGTLMAASAPLLAWNAAGHRLTATIAWQAMDEETRTAAGRLLAAHPDYAVWLARNRTEDPAQGAFIEASTWPDDIRRDARFHDDSDAETRQLPGFPDMARHGRWHYIDQPLFAKPVQRPGDGELPLRMAQLVRTLGQRDGGIAARAYALPWLIHLVGDAHQPLHTVSRYDEEARGDEGGNRLWIDNPFHPRRHEMTLHAYWDDLPGPPWLRGERLEKAAERLAALGHRPESVGAVGQWLKEGRTLAETVVYEGLEGEVPTLTSAYHERAQRTANERIVLAGRRLALLLEKLLRQQ